MDVIDEKEKKIPNKTPMNIGTLLVEARENQKLTAQDIADQMNLALSVITKIENNQFDDSIPLTFFRGYLRSYAQKVGVDVETISADFDNQTSQQIEPLERLKVVSGFSVSRQERNTINSIFKMIIFVIIIALIFFGGWQLKKRFFSNTVSEQVLINQNELAINQINSESNKERKSLVQLVNVDSKNIKPSSKNISNATISNTAKDTQNENLIELDLKKIPNKKIIKKPLGNVASEKEVDDKVVSSVNHAAASKEKKLSGNINADIIENNHETPLKTEPVVSMRFQFFSDCWVKIVDANGEVLAEGIKQAGKVMPLKSVAPISVVLGEPSAVTLDYQGKPYDLSSFTAGRRAKLILE